MELCLESYKEKQENALIRTDTILSINIWNNFQNLLFKLLAQLGDQTDVFWKFYSPTDTLWLPKTTGRVLGYSTDTLPVLYHGFCHTPPPPGTLKLGGPENWCFQKRSKIISIYLRGEFSLRTAKISSITISGGLKLDV